MILTAKSLITRVGKNIGLSAAEIDYVLSIDKEHVFDIKMSNGRTLKAYRIQHKNLLGPYKGGVRFHPEVDIDEVRALSILMSLKTAAMGLPLGGGKGGISVDPNQLTEADLEELSRAYVKNLHEHIGPKQDIPAPDVNTNAKIIDWMVDEYEQLTGDTSKASFTGKSLENGGSLGRDAATGRGGMLALKYYLELAGIKPEGLTVAVQGIGNVGFFFAKHAEEELGLRIVAVGDSRQSLVVRDFENNNTGLSVEGFTSTRNGMIDDLPDTKHAKFIRRDKILEQDVDVLVCAALGDTINKRNYDLIKAPIILELANGPVDDFAFNKIKDEKTIIPDIIANSGGVIVSYLEWLQNHESSSWDQEKIDLELETYMKKAIVSMYQYSKENNVPLKEAALSLAIKRLLEAKK